MPASHLLGVPAAARSSLPEAVDIVSGECMWIDAGFAHWGEDTPGSDFLTIFIPTRHVTAASLHIAPIGAASRTAPSDISDVLVGFAGLLLAGAATRSAEAPFLDAVLDWVGTGFQPQSDIDGARAARPITAMARRSARSSNIGLKASHSGSSFIGTAA